MLLTHRLSSSSSTTITIDATTHYSFKPLRSLSSQPENPNPKKEKYKPHYRPPSSLDAPKKKYINLTFGFRYRYMESHQNVRPIGLQEPKYSPFGPGRVQCEWIGICSPASDQKVRSVEEGAEDPNLEEKRRVTREWMQGEPLTNSERKALVEKCHQSRIVINLN